MPNFLESMRLKNLFSTPGINNGMPPDLTNPATLDMSGVYGGGANQGAANPSAPMTTPPSSISGEDDIASLMKSLYHPSSDAGNQFQSLVNQYPQRENPSWLRRIGAMLVDYTKGPKEGQEFIDQPFNEKLMDWKNKIGPSQQSANLERYDNSNDRTQAYQTATNILKERAQTSKDKMDERKATISEHRAAVSQWKAEHPGSKFLMPAGGNITAVDPITNKTTTLTDSQGNPIPTGSLTEIDKINANQENAMARIGEGGKQARLNETDRQENRVTNNETRGWGDPTMITDRTGKQIAVSINKITGEVKEVKLGNENIGPIVKPGVDKSKTETSTQKRVGEYVKARELMNTRPDLAGFIKLSGTSDFKITPQSDVKSYWSGKAEGPTKEQIKEINDAIYGGVSPTNESANKPITRPQTNTKTGAKRTLISYDKGKTWSVQ
jgi:hypothetical protein